MTQLTSSELEIIRQQPQSAQLYLSIFEPQIIFQAQINEPTINRRARNITYDNVSGSYLDVQSGFTMWIGTTPRANDVGKIRVKDIDASEIFVSENSNIDWQDDLYLTIFKYVELWPIYPRIITDPNDVENVIFYKDYNIAYTNQNDILGTFVCAGPHRAANLDPATGLASIYYSSTGSHILRGNIVSYDWRFEGATIPSSSLADPGYITYNMPGHYVTSLTISGSLGQVDTTYRYVSIYGQDQLPIQKWQLISGPAGSREEGGYTASIKVFEIIPIQENAVVVLYKKSLYGNTPVNLGGNFPNAGDIFFVGHIDRDSIEYDYEHSEVTFDLISMTRLMQKTSGFSVSVESVRNSNKWYELRNMDGRRAFYHYLRWHTTALMMADFEWKGEDYPIQFFDSNRESMYDALSNYMQTTLVGQVVADRQGKTWFETQAMAYENISGSFPPVMSIEKRDWMNTPSIEERLSPEVSYLEYGGVAYSGAITGTFAALIGSAPGRTPGFYGDIENHEGLAILGQGQLNAMVGNIYANRNSQFPSINMEITESLLNLDIAPQETVWMNINREDTVRNLAIQSLYIPNSMSWTYNTDGYSLLPNIEFSQLVQGISGETVRIPITPEDEIGGGFNTQGTQIPPIPPLTIPATGGGINSWLILEASTTTLSVTNSPQYDILQQRGSFGTSDIGLGTIQILESGLYQIECDFEILTANTAGASALLIAEIWDSGFSNVIKKVEVQRQNPLPPATTFSQNESLTMAFSTEINAGNYIIISFFRVQNIENPERSITSIVKLASI